MDSEARGYKGKSGKNIWSSIRALINVGVAIDELSVNPFAGLRFVSLSA